MALTTISGLTQYDNCDAITTWTGVDGVDTDEKIEGTGCLASDVDIETDIMLGPTVTSINMSTTKYAIYPWIKNFTAAYLDTKANGGLFGALSDGTNTSYWYVGGSDSYPGGWEVLSFNTDASPSGNSGTAANLASITRMGFGFKGLQKSKLADNSFLDYYRYASGSALRIYGTNTVTDDLWSEVLTDDTTLIAGVIKSQAGSYVLKGPIELGDSVGTTASTITDDGSVIIFDGGPVGDLHHGITGIGNSTGATSITLNNQTILSAGGRFAFDQTDTNLTSFLISGGSLTHAGAVKFKSGQTVEGVVFTDSLTTSIANAVTGSTFAACGLITMVAAGSLTNCIIDEPTGAVGVTSPSPADAALISNSTFISDGTGNGLEITGTAANMTLTGVDFTGYSTTVDANKAIYVNIASGSMTLSISGGSGVTLDSHVRTAGATVTVAADPVDVQVTTKETDGDAIGSALVFLKASDGTGPFPYQDAITIARSGTSAFVTHTAHGMATNDYVSIEGCTEANFNGVKQISVISTISYSYTVVDTGSFADPNGTSTFVALYGSTNATTGILSTSRVYSSDQPVTGWSRKSSGSPYYKEGTINGIIYSASGLAVNAVMGLDE